MRRSQMACWQSVCLRPSWAAAGLVAPARAARCCALGTLTGSLGGGGAGGAGVAWCAAEADADVAVGELVGRFSLVVLVPLAVGLADCGYRRRLGRAEPELAVTGRRSRQRVPVDPSGR